MPTSVQLMAILNLTPDSFSDGGQFFNADAALRHAETLLAEGADILDIGAESSRPGAKPVSADEEIRRLKPVLNRLSQLTDRPISVDTTKSQVAAFALENGATLINDISAFNTDPQMPTVIARHHATVVLMHMQGTPQTMQNNPVYNDVITDINQALSDAINQAKSTGIQKMIVDPGIGFGKTTAHNLEIIRRLPELKSLGYPILIGASRKRFIGEITQTPNPKDRLIGTLLCHAEAIRNGATFLRVHDVKAHKEMLKIIAEL